MANLHEAAFAGDAGVLKRLLEAGAEVDEHRDTPFADRESTALHVASEHGHMECVQHLISHGAATETADLWSHTPAHLAAQDDHVAVLKVLIAAGPGSIHMFDDVDRTPLHLAAQFGALSCLRVLLDAGAHIDPKETLQLAGEEAVNQTSAVHAAASYGQVACLRALLQAGGRAAANLRDTFERTPLHVAAEFGHVECIEALLEHGADIDAQCTWGATALHFAVKGGHTAAVSALVCHGSDVTIVDGYKQNALHMAARDGVGAAAAELISAGAPLNAENGARLTPLCVALLAEHLGIARALLQRGASLAKVQSSWSQCLPGARSLVAETVQTQAAAVGGCLEPGRSRATPGLPPLVKDVVELVLTKVFDVDVCFLQHVLLLNTGAGEPALAS